jgi:hypothetical protein
MIGNSQPINGRIRAQAIVEIEIALNSGTEIELTIPASIAYLASAPRQSRNRTAMKL